MTQLYKAYGISIVFAIGVLFCAAQNPAKDLREARLYFESGRYFQAWELLSPHENEVQAKSEHAYRYGVSKYYLRHDRAEVVKWLEISAKENYRDSWYYIAACFHQLLAFDKARQALENYSAKLPIDPLFSGDEIQLLQTQIDSAEQRMTNPAQSTLEPFGFGLNTVYDEYAPLVTGDQRTLLYTARLPNGKSPEKDDNGRHLEDIYWVSKNDADQWGSPVLLNDPLNSEENESALSITPDGRHLLLFKSDLDGYEGNIFYSSKNGLEWSEPALVGGGVNSDYQEFGACLSPDGQVMYFSSNRPGGYGGRDLYRSVKLPDGEWSLPVNLGTDINSPFNDDAPFIDPTGRTLYFSSEGWGSMGGYDIYASHLQNGTKWSSPVNLNYPINTVNDDLFFSTSLDGMTGYFSSERQNGKGGQDLYMVALPSFSPAVQIYKGIALSNDQPVRAKITVYNTIDRNVEGIYFTHKTSGKFLLALPQNGTFELVIEMPEFERYTEQIQGSLHEGFETKSITINLTPRNE